VHRVIKALLHGKRYHLATGASQTPRRAAGAKPRSRARPSEEWERPARIAAPTSAAPTKPRATSRPGSSAATCASTSARSTAAPSRAVTSFGLFVHARRAVRRGLVHITELGGEYYRFDEAARSCAASARGVRYTVGARVRCR
jgi:ribonuclease R